MRSCYEDTPKNDPKQRRQGRRMEEGSPKPTQERHKPIPHPG